MSLSPVIGTDVPETANGVVTPVSLENGPHAPALVKCGGCRLPGTGEESLDGSHEYTENKVENRVYTEKKHSDTEKDLNERTSSLSINSPKEAEPSLNYGTCTGDSESRDIPGTSKTNDAHNLVLFLDSAQHGESKNSRQRGGPTDIQQTVTGSLERGTEGQEEVDGEREKQDEENDEKNKNNWRSSGGSTEMKVSGQ